MASGANLCRFVGNARTSPIEEAGHAEDDERPHDRKGPGTVRPPLRLGAMVLGELAGVDGRKRGAKREPVATGLALAAAGAEMPRHRLKPLGGLTSLPLQRRIQQAGVLNRKAVQNRQE